MTMQDEIAVESGVPMPDPNPGRRSKYPWARMKVGDSFVVRFESREQAKARQGSIRSSAANAAKQYQHRYTLRVIEENGLPAIRVWRTQ